MMEPLCVDQSQTEPKSLLEITPSVDLGSTSLEPKRKGWVDPLVKACDKFFNCAYVKKQLEEEWREERQMSNSAVERLWTRMDKGMEVEVYRQFLFEENGMEPFEEQPHQDHRDSVMERADAKDQEHEKRTS